MILITGANGFIGSQVARSFLDRGQEVVGVDPVALSERPWLKMPTPFLKFLHRDQLTDYLASLKQTQLRPRWIIHMGANSSTTESDREHLLTVNTRYTQNLFQWCAEEAVPLIFASSAATYGNGEQGYNDQGDPNLLSPLNYYGESKLLVDRWALTQQKTPPKWYALRFFNVYGPGEYYKGSMISVPYKAFQEIHKTGKLKLFKSHRPDYADGEQKRDFIYVQEIVDWIQELMEKRPPSGIYNMGTGQARSWVDLGRAAFAALGKKENIEFIEMPDKLKTQYQYFTEASMSKWISVGMSPPRWSLEEGIKDYYLNHLIPLKDRILQ